MGVTLSSVLLAVLLPPLGVFLRFGLGRWFWIDVALTILGWLPGADGAIGNQEDDDNQRPRTHKSACPHVRMATAEGLQAGIHGCPV